MDFTNSYDDFSDIPEGFLKNMQALSCSQTAEALNKQHLSNPFSRRDDTLFTMLIFMLLFDGV